MRVYLLRHGDALPAPLDPERPLSPRGCEEVRSVATQARGRELGAPTTLCSSKLRARQTAALTLETLGHPGQASETPGLLPGDPVEPWVTRLGDEAGDLLLVGHNPFMEELTGALTRGSYRRFSTATMVCLERDEDGLFQVLWQLDATC